MTRRFWSGLRFRRLRVDLGTIITFGVLGQAILLIGLGYWGAQHMVSVLAGSVHRSEHQRVEDKVYAFLDRSVAVVKSMAAAPRLEPTGVNSEETAALLWALLAEAPELDSVYVADDFGHMLMVLRYPQPAVRYITRRKHDTLERWFFKIPEDVGGSARDRYETQRTASGYSQYNPLSRTWYQRATTEGRPIWTDPYVFDAARELGITYAISQSHESEQGAQLQVVSADVTLGRLSDFVRQFSRSGFGESALLSGNNEVLASSEGARRMDVLEVPREGVLRVALDHFQDSEFLNTGFTVFHEGEDYLVQVSTLNRVGWTLVSWVPEQRVLGDVRRGVLIAFVAALAFLLAVLLLSWRVGRGITRPIETLAVAARQIGQLKLEELPRVRSSLLEIQHLDQALDESARGLKAFMKFVPVDVVGQLIDQGHDLSPSGSGCYLTVMFIDVLGFSRVAESISPAELVQQITAYFEMVATEVDKRGGTIDKFVGDGIMVLWGAPAPLEDPEYKACKTALAVSQGMNRLNRQWNEQGLSALPVCIGIHSGPVVTGLFGSPDRLAYTALGDTVNVASRIEELNRQIDSRILISETTHEALAGRLSARPRGTLPLRGREESLRVWELLSPDQDEPLLQDKHPDKAMALDE